MDPWRVYAANEWGWMCFLGAKRALWLGYVCLCISILASCSAPATSTPAVSTTEDLLDALRDSGYELSETAILGAHFTVPGQVVGVDSALVYIYQFDDPAGLHAQWERLLATQVLLTGDDPVPPDHVLAWSSGHLIVLVPGPSEEVTQALEPLLGAPIAAEAPFMGEPFPPAISTAIGEIAQALEADPGELTVVEYESIMWPDSCLGYPHAGERCDPPAVQGWRLVLGYAGEDVEVHTDLLGEQVRLP